MGNHLLRIRLSSVEPADYFQCFRPHVLLLVGELHPFPKRAVRRKLTKPGEVLFTVDRCLLCLLFLPGRLHLLPVDSVLKTGVVTGQQIRDWLENELENAFAKDPAKRFGGWLVRLKGLTVTFTVRNRQGERVRSAMINGEPLALDRRYTMLGCEREGDPDNIICRLPNVADPRRLDVSIHDVLTDYLVTHSPVAPVIEGRAVATDVPATLLSQLEGTNYRFR